MHLYSSNLNKDRYKIRNISHDPETLSNHFVFGSQKEYGEDISS